MVKAYLESLFVIRIIAQANRDPATIPFASSWPSPNGNSTTMFSKSRIVFISIITETPTDNPALSVPLRSKRNHPERIGLGLAVECHVDGHTWLVTKWLYQYGQNTLSVRLYCWVSSARISPHRAHWWRHDWGIPGAGFRGQAQTSTSSLRLI